MANVTSVYPAPLDGDEFDRGLREAVQDVYDTGEARPIAFSHTEQPLQHG